MRIIGDVTKVLSQQIHACLRFLGEEYISLDYTIEVIGSRKKLEKERQTSKILKEEEYQQILDGKFEPPGVCIHEKKLIRLFRFNLNDILDKDKQTIEFIANLYHEVRHAYQFQKGMFPNEKEIAVIDDDPKAYFNLSYEIDAYKFQEEQINKNQVGICNVMRIYSSVRMGKQRFVYQIKPEISAYWD
ncbi:hypothetical protein CN372_14000 [Bacillus anthracis]|nr:hypothetical protein CN372_14000 [Bacillus anthracis]PGX28288.1 hypothetical protein COE33_13490 [Bacillus anthracis]